MNKDFPGQFVFKAVCSHCNRDVLVSFSNKRSDYTPEFTLYEIDKKDYEDREWKIHTCRGKEWKLHACCGKGEDCDCLK
jgi:hypothetical protein